MFDSDFILYGPSLDDDPSSLDVKNFTSKYQVISLGSVKSAEDIHYKNPKETRMEGAELPVKLNKLVKKNNNKMWALVLRNI